MGRAFFQRGDDKDPPEARAQADAEIGETQALLAKGTDMEVVQNTSSVNDQLILLFWAAALIIVSTSQLYLNSFMIHKGRFPFAGPLVTLQMMFSSLFGGLLLLCCPALFPSLTDKKDAVSLDRGFVFRRLTPIAICQAASLVLSNEAYRYASIPFLQMLKQSNVFLVYTLSLLAGLEAFGCRQALIILSIVAATTITVSGELRFSIMAFSIQGICCLAESCKVVLQGILVGGSERKLDPVSFVLLLSPQIVVLLLVPGILELVSPGAMEFMAMPTRQQVWEWKIYLVGSALVTFMFNVILACFLKYGSPLGLLFTMIVKDAMIVVASSLLFGSPISQVQMVSFPFQLLLILLYILTKKCPKRFENEGFVGVFKSLVDKVPKEI